MVALSLLGVLCLATAVNMEDIACGTPVLGRTQSLVHGGKAVARGAWPWLVAFYKTGEGNLEFKCGGNLISKIHVITAAHCIQDKERQYQLEAKQAVVFLGRHNLDDWNELGSQKRGIERFIVHEDWNPFDIEYDADIAIIVMDSDVEYSQYVRPLCVWEFSDNSYAIVGQRGALAGWGFNEKNNLNSDYPKLIEVPIVDDGECYKSNAALYAVSSKRTFCAGDRNGTGPCQGDSGGGLVLKEGNKWYLRGLVSTAPSTNYGKCDTNSYAVFTDVAKFVSWIALNTVPTLGVEIKTWENINCGTPVFGLNQSLVYNGAQTVHGAWPWIAALYFPQLGKLEFICGGNLITESHIITAAHCIHEKGKKSGRYPEGRIYLGSHNLKKYEELGSQIRTFERFIVHEDWNPFDLKYDADIAIIVMDSPVEYSQYVQPICVWEFSDNVLDVVGQRGALAGWGFNENKKFNSEFPIAIEVPISKEGECLTAFEDTNAIPSDRTFCTLTRYDKLPCQGDGGGGLVLKKENKWYLRGLVSSASIGTCDTNKFAVFTDVAKFIKWIAKSTQL